MNLPNSITVARLLLTGVFVAGATMESTLGHWIALIAFVVAAISDFLDGYLARKMGLVTNMGKLIDPLADKILVSAAYVYLTAQGLCPVWITVVIIGREFLVTGLRQLAVEAGQVIPADWLGKWKTGAQLCFCITGLTHFTFQSLSDENPAVAFFQTLSAESSWLLIGSLWASLILTVWSGWNYTWNARSLISGKNS
ncbi:MAG: CDP-diacylglycerol--glycerol-3-phosphate 3-phosphatidyltransferase [Akkermansiaceae bacterium]|nr:CDP-diacylglycerol--glycerol-3-phosphate 3-phosphatidyltransferase [Akkermansiaceae bacterium]